MNKKISLNRLCPFCKKDCGCESENYPFDTVVWYNCKKCNAPLTNNHIDNNFVWEIRNWYMTKPSKNGNITTKYFTKWGQKEE